MTGKTSPMMRGVVACALLAGAGANAEETRESTPGYAQDSSSSIVRTTSGDCLHTGTWKPDDANVVGCDGVTLVREIDVIEGAPSGLIATVSIPAAALFAFDSDKLTDEGKSAIEEYRRTLRPEISEAYAGIIIGHTDSTGAEDYNMGLSKRRANAVAEYLTGTGVDAGKLRAIGRGEKEPIATNDTDAGRAMNRRVDIVVIAEPRALDTIRFPSVALFPRRSAEITPQGMQLLEQNRETALDLLSRASYVEVVGHTDDVGDDNYNLDLSLERANSVRNYLIEVGVDPDKIIAVGMGESMPVASNTTDEGRAENRRVDVLVLGRTK